MKTLRGRLFASLGLTVVVSTVLTVVVAGLLTRAYVERQIVRNLQRQVSVAATAIQGGEIASGERLRLYFARQGELLLLPDAPPGQGAGLRIAILATNEPTGKIDALGRTFLFAVADSAGEQVVLARPARASRGDWKPYLVIVVAAGLGGAAVAAAVSYVLARRLAGPLRRVSDASRRLARGDDAVRVPVEGEDELALLAGSFNQLAEDLARAREAERSFLLSVSHELKTPLTAIRGYAEGVADGATPPEEAGRIIGRESERLDRLVRDLLDLARLDQRRFSVARDRVALADLAEEVRERYAPRAREFRVELTTASEGPAHAYGDRDRLVQAASNLVENALRSTPAGGRVAIRTADGLIRVEDTGPGLAPEDLPHAFDRFYLHSKYLGDRSVGSGLGLAIVRELAETMGGSVSVTSEPGRGSAFELRLPAG